KRYPGRKAPPWWNRATGTPLIADLPHCYVHLNMLLTKQLNESLPMVRRWHSACTAKGVVCVWSSVEVCVKFKLIAAILGLMIAIPGAVVAQNSDDQVPDQDSKPSPSIQMPGPNDQGSADEDSTDPGSMNPGSINRGSTDPGSNDSSPS